MSFAFDSKQGLIIVNAELTGPSGAAVLRLALDTGATSTLINTAPLVALGYQMGLSAQQIQVTTGSGVEFVQRIEVAQIQALGQTRANFSVLCHTLPPSTTVDGLLGLDFLRGRILSIDFVAGTITLR
jgi:predicted aspartyl protease